MVNFFFDTYAIIELVKGNPKFARYGEYPLVTTLLNKIELCWWALNYDGEEFARILLKSIETLQEVTDDVIGTAMKFRKEHKKKDFAYADCIGYAFAQKHGLLFLTGDKQFRGLPGVELVE